MGGFCRELMIEMSLEEFIGVCQPVNMMIWQDTGSKGNDMYKGEKCKTLCWAHRT